MSASRSGRVPSRTAVVTIKVALGIGTVVIVIAVALLAHGRGPVASVGVGSHDDAITALRAVVGDLPMTTLTVDGTRDGTVDGGASLTVLVAATSGARERGLQGVSSLPEDLGMLFILPDPPGPDGRPGFWMLDVPIALDIAFLAGDIAQGAARVVAVATMVPCPSRPCPITRPDADHAAALEVVAGGLTRAGIDVGTTLRWDQPHRYPRR